MDVPAGHRGAGAIARPEARLVSHHGLVLVGLPVRGRLRQLAQRVPPAWQELARRLEEIPQRVDSHLFYGVFPESDQHQTDRQHEFTYWVAVAVTEGSKPPQGMETLTLPERRYGVYAVRGDREAIGRAYQAFGRWLAQEGLSTDRSGYGFELYDERRQSPLPPYGRFDFQVYRPLP